MATFEQVGLALQLVQNLYGLVRDVRDNAADYKAKVAIATDPNVFGAKPTTGAIATGMKRDANLYLQRLAWVDAVIGRNEKLLGDALTALGLSLDDAKALRDTLGATADHTSMAELTDAKAMTDEADLVLASVPAFERIW